MRTITTYDQLLDETDSEKVYLAEIEPCLLISNWTLAPGMSNTYQAALSRESVPIRLKENDTDQEKKNTITEVEAQAGAWSFNSTAGLLYLHASDSTDPNSKTTIVYLLETFATHGRVFNNLYYRPSIARIPEVRQVVSESNTGNSIQSSGGLSLLEDSGDPYWINNYFRLNWLNKRAVLKLGGADPEYPYSEFKTVARWVTKGGNLSDRGVDLKMADLKSLFKTRIELSTFELAQYPNIDSFVEGREIPKAFGQIHNAPAFEIDPNVGTGGKWKLAEGPINAITAVYDEEKPISYTANTAAGEFTLNATPQGSVTADFNGYVDGGQWLSKPGEIAKYVLRNLVSLSDDDLWLDDFDDLDTSRNYILGIYIGRAVEASDILSKIENSAHAFFYTDRATGKVRVQTFSLSDISDPNRAQLEDDNLFKWQVNMEQDVFPRIEISYKKNMASNDEKFIQLSDLESVRLNDADETKTIDTFLANKTDAEALASIILPFYARPKFLAKAETHLRPLDRNLYENAEVIRDNSRLEFPGDDPVFRIVGFSERAGKDKKRVNLTLVKNYQPGS